MTTRRVITLLFFVIFTAAAGSRISEEKKVINKLMAVLDEADTLVPPIFTKNTSSTSRRPDYSEAFLRVNFDTTLLQILSLDEIQQTLKTELKLEVSWKDRRLQWNPGNKTVAATEAPKVLSLPWTVNLNEDKRNAKVNLPRSAMWTPQVVVGDCTRKMETLAESQAEVDYLGVVRLWMDVIVETSCSIDMRFFPFDVQICPVKFTLVDHDYNEGIQFGNTDITTYVNIDYSEWELIGSRRESYNWRGRCMSQMICETFGYKLGLRRRGQTYKYLLLAPTLLLLVLSLLIYGMRPRLLDRNLYGIAVFGGFFILLLMVHNKAPRLESYFSYLGVYLMSNMVVVVASMLLSAIVSFLNDQPDDKSMPTWMIKMLDTCFRPHCCKKNRNNWENITEAVHVDVDSNDDIKTMIRATIDGKKDNWKRLAKLANRIFFLIHLILVLTSAIVIGQKLQNNYWNGRWQREVACTEWPACRRP